MEEIPESGKFGPASAPLRKPSPLAPEETFLAGPNGVWPVWRLLVYVCSYYVLRVLMIVAAGAIAGRVQDVNPLWLELLEECLLLLAALAPAWVLSKLEMRPFGHFGLPLRARFGKNFFAGLVWGLAGITLLLATMHGIGVFDFGTLAAHGLRAFKFALFWGVFFLVVALYEDFLFRGYSLVTLSEATGFWPAAVLVSIPFGAIHLFNPGETLAGALGAACIGLFFCFTLRRTGALWFAVGMHAAWDWGESFLYSVPDSGTVSPGHLLNSSFHGAGWLTGGSVGPEGSIFLFLLIALMWAAFDRVYPARPSSKGKPGPDPIAQN